MTGAADRRFPRGVYGVGQEPDPRFSLANERTFLSWIRTALAFLALGAALHALPVLISPTVRFVAAVVLICVGMVVPVAAWLGWARTERALRTGAPLSASVVAPAVAAGIALAAVLLLVGMVA